MVNEDTSLEIINPPLRETYFYQMFSNTERGKKLCAEYSDFLETLWDNGTIDALNDKWLGADESRKTVEDYSQLPATNGTVRMAVDAQFPPFVYVKDNRIVGHNVDLAVMFCKAKGYSLVIENMTLSGAIASVKTGKSDFSQSMNKTPEREENTIFTSTPTIKAGNVLVALKSKESDSEGVSRMKLSDFEGKNIGLLIGSDSAKAIEDKIPGVKILFFDSPSHILPSLRSGRIDAFYCAEPTAKNIMQNHHDLTYVPEYVRMTQHTTMFQNTEKGRKLCAEYADFLRTLSEDGTIANLTEKWITGTDESKQVTEDYSNLPATNGTLTMSVTEGLMPFVFVKDKRIQGYDIDLAVLFCKHKGCGLNIEITNHNGVLSSLETRKCDFTYSVQWTEERDKTVLFSPVPNAVTGSVLVVMKKEEPLSPASLHDISDLAGKKV
ncbi:MAG: transporter substrate-binding domain-containing protein, partial [Synergistaceae bacterium]|nr:transporter substrate-binding domain-containing protein [Synergistaceae bacterium]